MVKESYLRHKIKVGGVDLDNIIWSKFNQNPIVAAVRDEKQLNDAIKSPCEVIFILKSNIMNFKQKIRAVKESNKIVFIHIDMIEGLGSDHAALEFICKDDKPHGIITTRSNLIKYSKALGLCTIQRFFLIDSLSLNTAISMAKENQPDAVEIMPGIIPSVIEKIKENILSPIITGGMISTKDDVINALKAGAFAVSVSKNDIWDM